MCLLLCLQAALLIALSGAEEDRVGIVGGNEARPHSRPYMVSLQDNRQHLCGGILIRQDFVLTAAHCEGVHRVVLGAHSLSASEASKQELEVRRSYPHPGYNREFNDIMLLKLNGNANLTASIQPISLMTAWLPSGKVCSTAGWGDVGDNHTFPGTLQEVNATTVRWQECARRWSGAARITRRMVCATGQAAFQGFCSGDSGGPLVCDGKAAGVVSFSGRRCGDPETPDVYTNICSFKWWIRWVLKHG